MVLADGTETADDGSGRRRVVNGRSLEVRLALLPGIFRSAALRSWRLHAFAFAAIVFVLWAYRRPLLHAWQGADEPLTVEELTQARQWWSGFGLGLSFDAKLKVEVLADAGFERLRWDDFLDKAMGKKGQTAGNFVMLVWRQNVSGANSSKHGNRRKGHGKVTCKTSDAEVCILCFVPGSTDSLPVGGLASLKNKTVRGTLTRLGRENKFWLEKTKWNGDAVLPLLFSLRWPSASKTELNDVIGANVPDQLAGRRVLLLFAALLLGLILRGLAVASCAFWDFTKHPSFKMLRSFPDIAPNALAVAREIDREAVDDSPITGSRVMHGGCVIITTSWLIHCPTAWTFAERALQPAKTAIAWLLHPSVCLTSLRSQAKDGKCSLLTALSNEMHEWWQLLRCSGLCGVEITRLRDCVVGSRIVFNVHLGISGDYVRVSAQHRLVLKDKRLGLFIEIPGEAAELDRLAREITLRQAVDQRATRDNSTFFGRSPPWDHGQESHGEALDQHYVALGLSRADIWNVTTPYEVKLLLRRAFRKRALATHPDKAGQDEQKRLEFERAAVALEVLSERLDAGLQM